ncbi:DEKNAAC105387 [Brettanomyces naardenensis]|uniref:DEKNAAC105387 n=1 Tax=Brettanomyces naardenensis TaxID=13370 RepID=A0A448YTK3_BRENA|nr:DEKNAAC105387 [Brettanomyces naardenensis]
MKVFTRRRFRWATIVLIGLILFIASRGWGLVHKEALANAAFYTYISDTNEQEALLRTVKSIESNFNYKFGYDWVFSYYDIEGKGFPEDLRSRIDHMTSGTIYIEEITRDNKYFDLPGGIDIDYLRRVGMSGGHYGLIPNHQYLSYKLKNRFQSYGYQFLETLKRYRYVCNVEVNTELMCDVDWDFIKFTEQNKIVYGFSYAPVESISGIRTLYKTFEGFLEAEGSAIDPSNMIKFVKGGTETAPIHTLCNLDSNMGIIDMEILRSEHYRRFFEHMDSAYGIFYERWTDYSLITMYLSTYVSKEKIFWIPDTGYQDVLSRRSCPLNLETRMEHGCVCDPRMDLSFSKYSCLRRFFSETEKELPKGVPEQDRTLRFKRLNVQGGVFERQFSRLDGEYAGLFLNERTSEHSGDVQ